MAPEHQIIPVTLEWLETMRGLLLFGWMILFLWFTGTLMHEAGLLSSKKVAPTEFCKVHLRPLSECPPGSHGQ